MMTIVITIIRDISYSTLYGLCVINSFLVCLYG